MRGALQVLGVLRPWSLISLISAAAVLVSLTTAGTAVADPGPFPNNAVAAAWSWVDGQLGSGTAVTSASTITGSRTYPADWTAAVGGSFTPQGVSSPVTDPSSIVVDSPAQVSGAYAGTVAGHITLPPQAGRWIVQVYRVTDSGRTQVPLQASVAADGTFTLDLGAVSNPPAGTWELGLLDATASYAPTGTDWPGAYYTNWQIRAYVVTDTAYLVGRQPAAVNGTFSFASSQQGTKVFQLVDVNSGAVLAENAPSYGLVRSYAGSTRVYTYDQALALVAATDLGVADAARLTSGLLALQNADGGFDESADVRNPQAGTPIVRTGITATATYALLRRLQSLPSGDASTSAVTAGARAGLSWLLARRNGAGLLTAGQGDYRVDGSIDPSATPSWVSTEHNIDAWQALHLAGIVLGGQSYTTAATQLGTSIVTTLWDSTASRFDQGVDAAGNLDTTDPLDVSSWGALFLSDSGRSGLAAKALAHVAAFGSSTGSASGYRAYYSQAAFPNAPANVWAEGSGGVAVARARLGTAKAAAADLARVAALQQPDGSLPYATVADAATGMNTNSSVAATVWFVLASLGGSSIW